ncbi:hypothetical protein LEP1GSC061_3544 [Leptospira wolffii serovar Khorat str. Khorat-H2]|nr:hypothetical protein LEP1GSC061_3544 [Leptospira wolffii serovar Khorat str. Khorat-H2]
MEELNHALLLLVMTGSFWKNLFPSIGIWKRRITQLFLLKHTF